MDGHQVVHDAAADQHEKHNAPVTNITAQNVDFMASTTSLEDGHHQASNNNQTLMLLHSSRHRPWIVLSGCVCAMFATYGVGSSVGILQVRWAAHELRDSSPNAVAWIVGVNLFLNLFLPASIGPVFDRYGTRLLLGIGSLGYVLSFVVLAQCNKYWQFMLVYGVVNGWAGACICSVALSVPAQWFDERRGLALGLVCAGASVGGVSIPFLLEYTLAHLSFAWCMRIFALITFVPLVQANVCIIEKSRSTNPWKAVGLRWFTNSKFLLTMMACACFEFVLFNTLALIPSYAAANGFTTAQASTAVAIENAGSAVGRLLGGWLSDKVGRFNMLVFAITLTAAVMLCLWSLVYDSIARFYVSVAFFGAGAGSIISMAGVCFGELCHASEFGECWGTAYVVVSIIVLISVPTGDLLLQTLGGQRYIICSGSVLIAALIAALMARWSIQGYRWKLNDKV